MPERELKDETIQITLNGKEQEIKAGLTVSDLLAKWRMRPEVVTVEINEDILQKLDYDSTVIKKGDRIEFVFYMGGGCAGPAAAAAHFLTSASPCQEISALPPRHPRFLVKKKLWRNHEQK